MDIEDIYPTQLRWVEVLDPSIAIEACFEQTLLMMSPSLQMMNSSNAKDISIADIVFLIPDNNTGQNLIRKFKSNSVNFFTHLWRK